MSEEKKLRSTQFFNEIINFEHKYDSFRLEKIISSRNMYVLDNKKMFSSP